MKPNFFVVEFYEGCNCVARTIAFTESEAEELAKKSRGYDQEHDIYRNAYTKAFETLAEAEAYINA